YTPPSHLAPHDVLPTSRAATGSTTCGSPSTTPDHPLGPPCREGHRAAPTQGRRPVVAEILGFPDRTTCEECGVDQAVTKTGAVRSEEHTSELQSRFEHV